ncbi:MAG: LamG domain-containing protein [Calditrichota bacterium]
MLDLHQGDGLTVVFWVKTNVQNVEQTFGAKYNSVGSGGWHITQTVSGHAYFAGRAPGAYVYNDSSDAILNDNQWHLVVGMINGSSWTIWVDGSLQRTVTGTQNPSMNNSDPFVIGCHIDVSQRASYWEGDIDDISIYNRALSAAEITTLFNQ